MVMHFETKDKATDHLASNGWTQAGDGWLSRDKSCAASLHPRFDGVVAVSFWEIQQ